MNDYILLTMLFYATVSIILGGYLLFRSGEEDPVYNVAMSATVVLIWPLMAVVFLLSETIKLIPGRKSE